MCLFQYCFPLPSRGFGYIGTETIRDELINLRISNGQYVACIQISEIRTSKNT